MPLDNKEPIEPLHFNNEEEAQEYLSELIVPQWVTTKLINLNKDEKLSDEELNGNTKYPHGFRNVAIVALKAGTFNGVPYNEDVIKKHAESWVKQPNGRQGYFKMNHGNDVLKRAGPIEESYWCEDEKVVIHKGKITVPEFIERWDAKVLDTTSVEMGVGFDLEKSKPGKLVPSVIQGRDNAFVENPACKTCGTTDLAILETYLENHDIELLNDALTQRENLCEPGTAEGDALWSLFSSIYGRFFNNLEDKELPAELTGDGSATALKKTHDANLDKDGNCKLDPAKDMGHCLSVPDVKRLTGNALGLGNTNYLRPIMYEGFRQGKIDDSTLKKAGYDPESPSLKGVNNMVDTKTIEDDKSLKEKLFELLGVKPEDVSDKPKDKKEDVDMSGKDAPVKTDDKDKPVDQNLGTNSDSDPPITDAKVIADLKAGCKGGNQSDCDELEEQGIDTSKLADDTSTPDPKEVAGLTAKCKDGDIASCGALKKMGVKLEDIGVEDMVDKLEDKKTDKTVTQTLEEQGMVAVKTEDLQALKDSVGTVINENKELKGRVVSLEDVKLENEKTLFNKTIGETKTKILSASKRLNIPMKAEDLKQEEKEEDSAYEIRLNAEYKGLHGIMQKLKSAKTPYVEPMELHEEEDEPEDEELTKLEEAMDNLWNPDEKV